MQLFKFVPATSPTILEQGEAINKIVSVMWVERYQDPGEFEIVSKLSSGLWEFLPLGTLISHSNTMEVMIVENHQITEGATEDPVLKTTGRSLDSILEQRIVGVNGARSSSTIAEYVLPSDWTWNQAVKLINDHIAPPANAGDVLTNLTAAAVAGIVGTQAERVLNRGPLSTRLLELLQVDDLGIKTVRRNTFSGFGGSNAQTTFIIHQGANKSASVIFSWKAGDLEKAEYLFSNKRDKNSALVIGRYIYTMVDTGPVNYDRRIMIVDAGDIDEPFSVPPTGADLTTVIQKMQVRGNAALQAQMPVNISRADISKTTKYEYRRDYNIGDFVTLDGNFGAIQVMRVVEYVEIEDENGESSHPTLALPEV